MCMADLTPPLRYVLEEKLIDDSGESVVSQFEN